jgi:plastocyanin
MKRVSWRGVGIGLAVLGAVFSLALPAIGATTKNVSITSYMFSPGSLTIHVGDKVIWKNNDPAIDYYGHTATSNDSHTFDSGNLSPGQSYSFTFLHAGTFAYHCNVHPTQMHGTIIVVGSTPSPSPSQSSSPSPTPTHARPKATATATAKPTVVPVSPTPTSSVKPSPRVSKTLGSPSPSSAPSRVVAAASSSSQTGITIGLIAGALVILVGGGLLVVRKRRTVP